MQVDRRFAAHGVRGLVLGLLALALLAPTWSSDAERVDVIVVEDTSASIADHTSDVLERDLPEGAVVHHIEANSDLGAALADAADLVPIGGAGRIVLMSDGRATDRVDLGDARVDVVALESVAGPSTPDLPSHIAPGESVDVRVSAAPDEATLNGELLPIEMVDGALRVDADLQPGLHDLVLHYGDTTREARVHVEDAPRVLIVVPEEDDADPVSMALEAEQFQVEVFTPSELSSKRPDPAAYDLVLLADVPAYSHVGGDSTLDPAFLHELRREVSGGLGLVVFGGTRSYDLGGWGESELGPLLPVKTNQSDGNMGAPVSVVVVLDNSGSMGQTVMEDGTNKLDLAVEGTLATRELLRSFDRLAVMSFDDAPHWFLRPENVDDRGNQVARIKSVGVGGGGIYVYTSLDYAYDVLSAETTPLRHVILFSDAGDSEEQTAGTIFGWGPGHTSYALAHSEWLRGVSTSVIGIGTEHDQDADFLKRLASEGGGRFYLTNDATELRALFMKETRRLVGSAVREKAYRPIPVQEHPMIDGIAFSEAPHLAGYVKLKPRDSAQVLAKGPNRDPWMITWRYGLGHVVAIASDPGNTWSSDFSTWEGWPRLHAQIARHALRHEVSGTTAMSVDDLGATALVRVSRRDHDGLARDDRQLALLLDGQPQGLVLDEPGLYSASIPWPAERGRLQLVVDGELALDRAIARPTPLEFGPARPELLQRIADESGGVLAASWTAPVGTAPFERSWPLWPVFAVLALLLIPVDAWLRRPIR